MPDVDLSDLLPDILPARTEPQFGSVMDKTFGSGKWRETSGYRTPAAENALRRQGAGTVPAGQLSSHSVGTPETPGARDVVVDGMTPEQVASRLKAAGAKFRHFFPEAAKGTQGAHLHIDTDLSPDPVDLSDLVTPAKPAAPPQPAPAPAPAAAAPRGALQTLASAFGDVPAEVAKQTGAALDAGLAHTRQPFKNTGSLGGNVAEGAGRLGQNLLDDLGIAGAPVSGILTSVLGRPVNNVLRQASGGKLGVDPGVVGDLASIAVPVTGEIGLANDARKLAKAEGIGIDVARKIIAERKAAPAVAKAATETIKPGAAEVPADAAAAHKARVDRLAAKDVKMTPGQIKGGAARRNEEADKSHPLKAQATIEAEDAAIRSFNRATYNEVLEPLGVKFTDKDVPDHIIGTEGIDKLHRTVSDSYNPLLPHMRAVPDKPLTARLAEIRHESGPLLGPYEKSLESVIDQRVLKRFGPEGMDGHTWKLVQGDLSTLSRKFHASTDPTHHMLADAIDDVNEALTENTQRHSDPAIVEKLKKSNAAWARLVRVEGAAANRATSGGTFTVGDLMAAIKRGDSSGRKSDFARGRALMQDFASDANAVLPNRLPDSGTAYRSSRNGMGAAAGAGLGAHVGGPPGAVAGFAAGKALDEAVSPVVNQVARHLIKNKAEKLLRPKADPALKRSRLSPDALRQAVGVTGAARTVTDPGDQPDQR